MTIKAYLKKYELKNEKHMVYLLLILTIGYVVELIINFTKYGYSNMIINSTNTILASYEKFPLKEYVLFFMSVYAIGFFIYQIKVLENNLRIRVCSFVFIYLIAIKCLLRLLIIIGLNLSIISFVYGMYYGVNLFLS